MQNIYVRDNVKILNIEYLRTIKKKSSWSYAETIISSDMPKSSFCPYKNISQQLLIIKEKCIGTFKS